MHRISVEPLDGRMRPSLSGLNLPSRLSPVELPPVNPLPVDSSAEQREDQHEKENLQQSAASGGDGLSSFREQGETSVDEFYVDPVDK